MERKKKNEAPHWVTSGVFFNEVDVMEAVQRITESNQSGVPVQHIKTTIQETDLEKVQQLEQEVAFLKEAIEQMDERMKLVTLEHKRERERLYQMVMLLKQEWERARDEHHHR